MTTLDLEKLAIAPASDLTDVLLIGQSSEVATVTRPSSVRRYAGGRDRVVSSPGTADTLNISLRGVSRSDWDTLTTDLVGVTVLVRDQRQRQIWGVIGSVSGTEFSASDLVIDASFSLVSITSSEVV